MAAAVIIVTQLWLVASATSPGSLADDLLIACSVADTSLVGRMPAASAAAALAAPPWYEAMVIAYAASVLLLSYR